MIDSCSVKFPKSQTVSENGHFNQMFHLKCDHADSARDSRPPVIDRSYLREFRVVDVPRELHSDGTHAVGVLALLRS